MGGVWLALLLSSLPGSIVVVPLLPWLPIRRSVVSVPVTIPIGIGASKGYQTLKVLPQRSKHVIGCSVQNPSVDDEHGSCNKQDSKPPRPAGIGRREPPHEDAEPNQQPNVRPQGSEQGASQPSLWIHWVHMRDARVDRLHADLDLRRLLLYAWSLVLMHADIALLWGRLLSRRCRSCRLRLVLRLGLTKCRANDGRLRPSGE